MFKKGDRVVIAKYPPHPGLGGRTGTVIEPYYGGSDMFAIQFDPGPPTVDDDLRRRSIFHDCRLGLTRGRWIEGRFLELEHDHTNPLTREIRTWISANIGA